MEAEGSTEQKSFLYKKILQYVDGYIWRMKIRMFWIGFFNKELKRKLYVVSDFILKAHEFLIEEYNAIAQQAGKGEDENILEYHIATQQLEHKIRQLDKEIEDKARILEETRQKPLYRELGAMLTLRLVAAIFVNLERDTVHTSKFAEELGKKFLQLRPGSKDSPLSGNSCHRPTNKWFPL